MLGKEEDVAVEHRFFGESRLAPVAAAGYEHSPDRHENERHDEGLGYHARFMLRDDFEGFDPKNPRDADSGEG